MGNKQDRLLVEYNKFINSIVFLNDIPAEYELEFGNLKPLAYVLNENQLKAYNEAIEAIRKKLSKDFSFKIVEDELQRIVVDKETNPCDSLLRMKDKYPIKQYWDIRPLHGITIHDSTVKAGCYKFIRADTITSYIENKLSELNVAIPENIFLLKAHSRSMCYVEVTCEATDKYSAEMKLRDAFIKLDSILRFMLFKFDKSYGLGIFNQRTELKLYNFLVNSNGQYTQHSSISENQPLRTIALDKNDYYFSTEQGHKMIWEIFCKENISDIEQRIMLGVKWIGMAINERDISIAFVQCMFAIEGLLKYEEKETMNKSIVAQISEFIAFIIGTNKDNRLAYEKSFKDLYAIRSKIAHGQYITDLYPQLIELLYMAKSIVVCLLINILPQGIDTMDKLNAYIKDLRYTC